MTKSKFLYVSIGVVALCLMLSQATVGFGLPSDDNNGGEIGVTIADPSDTASPTPSTSTGTSSSGGSSSGGVRGSNSSDGSASPGATPVPIQTLVAESSLSGVQVGGISARSFRDLNPFAGAVNLSVSVTNHTPATMDGTFAFRLIAPFGVQIGPTLHRVVYRVPPGKSRGTTASLPVGLWPLVHVTAEFTQTSAKTDLGPIERDAWVFPIPWLLVAVAILALAVFWILRLVRPEWFRLAGSTEPQ